MLLSIFDGKIASIRGVCSGDGIGHVPVNVIVVDGKCTAADAGPSLREDED